MTTDSNPTGAIRRAWSSIPTPPVDDLRNLPWKSGENAYRAFAGVAPMDVDITSPAFFGATSLADLPPRAAAAYLGPHLLHLVKEIEEQRTTGYSLEVVARGDTLAALLDPFFWESVIRPHLPPACHEALADVVAYITSVPELAHLTSEDVKLMRSLAEGTGG